ncbi:killer protein [Pantoea endophytica]|uniref:Killer protein n=1 Tax=Pantoea sp. BJ2 TaxID=3141322 RepID=A0AAU7U483_9GAMM
MNKILLLTLSLVMTSLSLHAKADEPCNMTICMFGLLSGEQSNECKSQVRKFFAKQESNKHGFLPDHTSDARNKMLQKECPATYGVNTQIESIISKFGRIKNI